MEKCESPNQNYTLARMFAFNNKIDEAFEYLDLAFEYYVDNTFWLFTQPEFKVLHDDPRWEGVLDRLSAHYNYDFKHGK